MLVSTLHCNLLKFANLEIFIGWSFLLCAINILTYLLVVVQNLQLYGRKQFINVLDVFSFDYCGCLSKCCTVEQ
jgi:hypothetical protein